MEFRIYKFLQTLHWNMNKSKYQISNPDPTQQWTVALFAVDPWQARISHIIFITTSIIAS